MKHSRTSSLPEGFFTIEVMNCKLFVFRHAETFDNNRGLFSGWRDSDLTRKGLIQAEKIAKQLKQFKIDYAFTSHLKRAKRTLKIVLKKHTARRFFVDDRIIERCYGLLQGKKKSQIEAKNPAFFEQWHRGYGLAPPKGESLRMVEKRTLVFVNELKQWLKQHPGNVAISCHNNSIRCLRRVFERLTINQMCKLESPQDQAFIYNLDLGILELSFQKQETSQAKWKRLLVPKNIRLATDNRNPLKKYY